MGRVACRFRQEEGNVQISFLLYSMCAKKTREIYNTFKCAKVRVPTADGRGIEEVNERNDNCSSVLGKFNEHFIPKKKVIYERLVFNERVQRPDETV